jgi:hypothetical protein
VQYAFVAEFGVMVGRAYGAFLQNLLMSVRRTDWTGLIVIPANGVRSQGFQP